jgi:DNA-binding NtrC family response regulator
VRLLVVDDEPTPRFALRDLLECDGHAVEEAEHAPAALDAVDRAARAGAPFDLVLTDLRMPRVDGLALLELLRRDHPALPVVLLTAHGDERTAVRALRLGAWDYVPKPYDNAEILAVVGRARELLALRAENGRLREELAARYHDLVGASPAMRGVYRLVQRAAPTRATVLVTGESGTGKELVARALHAAGPRARRPFVALNCAALPAELAEAELFGHVRGAFTGAVHDRAGLFEAADGGTLFLDEIGDMPLGLQAKLLRVLEAGEVTRVGATRPVAVDVRVVAATHRGLDALVAAGRFRDDLRYRVAVLTVELPPLRERREDVPALAAHFLAHFAERHAVPPRPLADDARRALLAHDWPGNVRELRNAIERALLLADGDAIAAADLPAEVRGSTAPLRPAEAAAADLPFVEARRRALDAFDRAFLAAALERHGGNVSAAARVLGLHRPSLQKLIARLGLRGDGAGVPPPGGTRRD